MKREDLLWELKGADWNRLDLLWELRGLDLTGYEVKRYGN
ncbi:hypothetical protein ES703_120648 [subsurface metagenome]